MFIIPHHESGSLYNFPDQLRSIRYTGFMYIHRDYLKSGMRLSEPIRDRLGRVLLHQDTVLDEGHIKRLKNWGIIRINIQEDSIEDKSLLEEGPNNSGCIKRGKLDEAQLKQLFKHTNLHHPFMDELYQQCEIRLS